jgi:hypothetical protein
MMRQRPVERNARAAGFLLAAVAALFGWAAQAAAGERPAVKHPNLLLNREEIEQVKEKIKRHEWAARLFERVKELANDQGRAGRIPREAALVYALTGDRRSTDPRLEYTMWLGNFDALGPARHDGMQKAPHEPVVADWLFFPHPVHRQGVLLLLPTKTPLSPRGTSVSFPLRAGREVVLRFATEEEVPALVKEKRSSAPRPR